MFVAANISSRTRFRRLCRVGGASLASIVFAIYAFLGPPSFQKHGDSAYSTLGPVGLLFVLLLVVLPIGSEWAADRFTEKEDFPMADKVFWLLPWVYLAVLGFAAMVFVFWIKDGYSSHREGAFILSILFLWLCPPEFRLLRVVAGLCTAAMSFTIWWTTPNAPYLVLAVLGVGASFTKPDFGVHVPIAEEARY